MNWEMFRDIAKLVTPIVIHIVAPHLDPISDKIGHAIGSAEAIPGASGTDKLNHVISIAKDAASITNTVTGKNTVDMNQLSETIDNGVSTAVSVINLLHDKVPVTGVN